MIMLAYSIQMSGYLPIIVMQRNCCITESGILELIDENTKVNPIFLEVVGLEEKAFGLVAKCDLADNLRTLKVIVKPDPESATRIKKLDLLEIRKENVRKCYVQNNYYMVIEAFTVFNCCCEGPQITKNPIKKTSILSSQPVPQQRVSPEETQTLSLEDIRRKGEALNKGRHKWNLVVRVAAKSEIKMSTRGTKWFDCFLQDNKNQLINMMFFDNVDIWYSKVDLNQTYEIERPTVFHDRLKNTVKLKAGLDTKFNPSDVQLPPCLNNFQMPCSLYNLTDVSQKPIFDKIVFCFYVETNRKEFSANFPVSLYICDEFQNIKKLNCWADHNVSIPEAESFLYLKNVSHRGDPQSEILHSTKDTKVLSEKEAFQQLNLTLNTFVPKDQLFYRKPYQPNIELTTLSNICKGSSYSYVVAVVFLDYNQIRLKSKCQSCGRIMDINVGCSCNRPAPSDYYSVKCRISDCSGSVSASIHSSLVQMIARIDSKDSSQVIQGKIKNRLVTLNLNKELLKIQVKYRQQRPFINIVDIFRSNLPEEIRMMTRLLEQQSTLDKVMDSES